MRLNLAPVSVSDAVSENAQRAPDIKTRQHYRAIEPRRKPPRRIHVKFVATENEKVGGG
jgi:hypothetical protein